MSRQPRFRFGLRVGLVFIAVCAIALMAWREYQVLIGFEAASRCERMNDSASELMLRDRQVALMARDAAAQFIPPDPSVLDQLGSIPKPVGVRVARCRSWDDLADSLARDAAYWRTQASKDRDLRIVLERRSLLHSWGISLDAIVQFLPL
jgi:hypothetical protein